MSVLFTPDDLQLVKRSASFRRDELDDFGRQANRGFASVLSTYTRSIEQRNRLLKEERPDLDLLDAWDASVALGGATLLHGRRLRLLRGAVPPEQAASSQGRTDLRSAHAAGWARGGRPPFSHGGKSRQRDCPFVNSGERRDREADGGVAAEAQGERL